MQYRINIHVLVVTTMFISLWQCAYRNMDLFFGLLGTDNKNYDHPHHQPGLIGTC